MDGWQDGLDQALTDSTDGMWWHAVDNQRLDLLLKQKEGPALKIVLHLQLYGAVIG